MLPKMLPQERRMKVAIDFKKIWQDRIKQIDLDRRKAIKYKKWSELKQLDEEKENLENRLR